MNILKVKNLNLGFDIDEKFYQALFNVNFNLEQGQTLAIVGESGCGKTMSVMSILKLLPSNCKLIKGEIIFNGENLLELSENKLEKIRGKKIALIPQDPMSALNPLYTIGNQLLEVINLHQGLKGQKALECAINALNEVKIPDAKEKLKAYPHELSGGMKQRLIIAMAVACQAQIIIADEPTTALDVTVQAQIMELLNEIKIKNNSSMILITHDLNLVAQNAQKTMVMYAGRVVEENLTQELIKSPKHPYTKALLKSSPNLNTKILQTIQGQPPLITDKINGCSFNPRCNNCINKCLKAFPRLRPYKTGKVACFIYDEYS